MEKPNIVFPMIPRNLEIFTRAQRLATVKDVARCQAKLINLVLLGRCDAIEVFRLVQMLSALGKTLQVSDLEGRLKELEKLYNRPEKPNW